MTSALLPSQIVFNNPLTPLGWLTFDQAGTTTPQAAYSDATGTVALANPLQLDGNGQAVFYLKSGLTYKINLQDVNMVQQSHWPQDNLVGDTAAAQITAAMANLAASGGAALLGTLQPFTGAILRTQADKNEEVVSVMDFMTQAMIADARAGTLLVDCTPAFQEAWNALAASNAYMKSLYVPWGLYKITTINMGTNSAGLPIRYRIYGEGTIYSIYAGFVFAPTGAFYDFVVDGVNFESVTTSGTKLFNVDQLIRLVVTPGTHIRWFDWVFYGVSYAQSIKCNGAIIRGACQAIVQVPLAYDCTWAGNILEGYAATGNAIVIGYAAWAPNHVYAVGAEISNGGNLYTCTTGGTSTSSGGPTGTGAGISDGTCVWNYTSANSGTACQAVTIRDNTIEGHPGTAITLGLCVAATIEGNYFEGNGIQDINCATTSAYHYSLKIQGNYINMPAGRIATGFGILWGPMAGSGGLSGSNFCNGGLHSCSSVSDPITMFGDSVGVDGNGNTYALWASYGPVNTPGRVGYGKAIMTDGFNLAIFNASGFMKVRVDQNEVEFGAGVSSPITGSMTSCTIAPVGGSNPAVSILTIAGAVSGIYLESGQLITGASVPANTNIFKQTGGTPGGAGTYQVNGTITISVAEGMSSQGNYFPSTTYSPLGATTPAASPGYFQRKNWAQGSVVWNSSVTATTTPGWVCTTAGGPGVWTAMPIL